MSVENFKARIAAARMLAPNVRELVLDRGSPFSFEAGQWVNLHVPGMEKRAYSIASPPDGPRFDLAVTLVEGGPVSTYLHSANIGSEIDVSGPQGFFAREKTGPGLYIGTGTGVAPLRAMMKDALAKSEVRATWLLFGIRTEGDILYKDELDALAKAHPNVRVIYTLSRGSDAWMGLRGYVQTHAEALFRELEARGEGPPHAYICGLHRMVGAVRDLLRKKMSVPREQVHSERYD
jgi:CDP-4-dehydro-6-deoxyglucose reductase